MEKTVVWILIVATLVMAGATSSNAQIAWPTVFISPTGDGFEVYLAAAMHKKKVPLTVVNNGETAAYKLTAAQVEVEKVSTGSKVTKCLFLSCAGIEDKASTSVQLVDGTGKVLWSYSVNKGRGAKNRQSMAESVAEHLKDDYLKKN